VQVLKAFDTEFATVNILADEKLRSGMKEYSQV
jgi:glutaredoxin-related protein